jgi:hypothetical protein
MQGLEGCVLKNSPGDCFSAPPLRPQAGKSRLPHQASWRETPTRKSTILLDGAFCFYLKHHHVFSPLSLHLSLNML